VDHWFACNRDLTVFILTGSHLRMNLCPRSRLSCVSVLSYRHPALPLQHLPAMSKSGWGFAAQNALLAARSSGFFIARVAGRTDPAKPSQRCWVLIRFSISLPWAVPITFAPRSAMVRNYHGFQFRPISSITMTSGMAVSPLPQSSPDARFGRATCIRRALPPVPGANIPIAIS